MIMETDGSFAALVLPHAAGYNIMVEISTQISRTAGCCMGWAGRGVFACLPQHRYFIFPNFATDGARQPLDINICTSDMTITLSCCVCIARYAKHFCEAQGKG